MPVRSLLAGDLLTLELAGTYLPEDIIRTFAAALEDPACPPRVSLLVDVTRSESLATRPAADIRNVARALGPYAERIGGRCAVVASSEVHFGLSQMGAAHSAAVGVEARVFRDREAARAWLASGRNAAFPSS